MPQKRLSSYWIPVHDSHPLESEFHWMHNLAVDSKGNICTTEVDTGKRAQKFRYVGPAVR